MVRSAAAGWLAVWCGFAGCSTSPTCVQDVVFPIAVAVTDSATGASLADAARGVAVGSERTDSLRLVPGPPPTLVGGVGKGPFEVRVAATGYTAWVASGIDVSYVGDPCLVPVTHHLEARLQRQATPNP